MGTGIIVIGIASVIIGEKLCGRGSFVRQLAAARGHRHLSDGGRFRARCGREPHGCQAHDGCHYHGIAGDSPIRGGELACLRNGFNIRKAFKRPDGSEHRVLEAVSFHVAAGQRAALMGPNGSGKTTLLRIITGELAPTSGSIVLRGSALDALPAYRRARMIGQVHQDSHKDIAADLSIKELLSMAPRRNHSLRLQWPTVEETIDSVRPLSGFSPTTCGPIAPSGRDCCRAGSGSCSR